jgi:hypothetical protein
LEGDYGKSRQIGVLMTGGAGTPYEIFLLGRGMFRAVFMFTFFILFIHNSLTWFILLQCGNSKRKLITNEMMNGRTNEMNVRGYIAPELITGAEFE